MDNQSKLPTMLTLLFGEAAETTRLGASRRLLRWCAAFDEWLEWSGARAGPSKNRTYNGGQSPVLTAPG
ncbi:MAG TPA: hypothetical protein VLA49_01690 [Anaerolineales bacterium]|nr:hypothetical protein [Anaerolineales bacterium]